mmetsp:Transcript_71309/g.220093  ORF Transcript_71309/g.220093 Transcript_71309/m.220093 type:complete len:194 (+) Transcript_71309:39-620(+)
MVFAAWQAYRYRLYYECVIGLMAMLTSTAYHVCESMRWTLFGYNSGRWHQMDNVFAIAALMSIILGYAKLPVGSAARELLNTSSVSLAVVTQLMSPWDLRFTIGPLVASLVVTLAVLLTRRRLPSFGGRVGRISLVFLAGAVGCFVKGLDQSRDRLRVWHGGWHIFVSGFIVFALRGQHAQPAAETEVAEKDK